AEPSRECLCADLGERWLHLLSRRPRGCEYGGAARGFDGVRAPRTYFQLARLCGHAFPNPLAVPVMVPMDAGMRAWIRPAALPFKRRACAKYLATRWLCGAFRSLSGEGKSSSSSRLTGRPRDTMSRCGCGLYAV